jgi:hypothetical protein
MQGVSDSAGSLRGRRIHLEEHGLPLPGTASAPWISVFRSSIPCLRVPLSTLRAESYPHARMTRGHRGSPALRCKALSSSTPCRFIPAHPRFLVSPCARALLSDPGGTSGPDHSVLQCGLPRRIRRRLPRLLFRGSITRPEAPPVYASRRRSPDAAQHSVPAGGQPWPDGTCTHGAASRTSISTSSSLLPDLAWRTPVQVDYRYLSLQDFSNLRDQGFL